MDGSKNQVTLKALANGSEAGRCWAGIGERFQRYSFSVSLLKSGFGVSNDHHKSEPAQQALEASINCPSQFRAAEHACSCYGQQLLSPILPPQADHRRNKLPLAGSPAE